MECYELPISLGATGAGTATTTFPVSGYVAQVRMPNGGTGITTGGTSIMTFTRTSDGGTVLALTSPTAPFEYNPRSPGHTSTGGTTAYSLGTGPVYDGGYPVDGYVKLVVSQGKVSGAGTVFIYVDSD